MGMPRFGADVLAPRRLGAVVLAPICFGAETFCRLKFWRRDVLAPIHFLRLSTLYFNGLPNKLIRLSHDAGQDD